MTAEISLNRSLNLSHAPQMCAYQLCTFNSNIMTSTQACPCRNGSDLALLHISSIAVVSSQKQGLLLMKGCLIGFGLASPAGTMLLIINI